MGAVTRPVSKALGISKPAPTPLEVVTAPIASQAKAITQGSSGGDAQAEDRSARRRARRGARALLSESRLNPEQGIATLGQTGL